MSEKLIIIDGNALIHRSFHALPTTLKTKDGIITNAAYGFASFLIKALSEIKPKYAILTMDKKAPTFRHKMYQEYKATRVKAPQELYDQIPMAKEIAQAFNIPLFELEGFEADDLIGTISQKINQEEPKIEIIIITGDMDTLQLVNKKTKVYSMSRGLSESVLYDEKKILEKYNLEPKQIIDFKALKGDPSDNIPGVSGIGEKTAKELLIEFKNLDSIYKNINSPKIKEKTKELLIKNKEMAYLSYQLATIEKNAPLKINLEETKIHNLDKNKINKIFSQLEFKSLLSRILNLDFVKSTQQSEDKFSRNKKEFKYELVDTEEKFQKFIKKIKAVKEFSLDTETDSIDPLQANLLGLSFCFQENEAFFLNIRTERKNNFKKNESTPSLFAEEKKLKINQAESWLEELKIVIEDEKTKKIGHNIKYDLQVLLNYGIEIKGELFDTMIASYLLNPENRQHNLDALTFSEFNWEKISSEELIGRGKEKIKFEEVEIEKLSLYSCEDADFTFKLKNKLSKKLKAKKLEKLFCEIEMPLVKILAEMERNGIILDDSFLKKLGGEIKLEIEKTEKLIWQEAKTNFNINSPKQLKEILYDKMGLESKGIKKTKTGFSTAAEELEKLKDLSPIIPLIQNYRELSKLDSTYIDSLPKLKNKKTNRIHTSFNQTITATGRLSSSDPNLQNIPVRTELGQKIRQSFVADKNKKLLSVDYSQIELRIMAHLSKDKKLLEAFKENKDIHSFTAASINKIPLEKVDEKLRYQAKATNFGIMYGQGPHGLSQTAGINYQEAKRFIDGYFELYSGVKKYIQKEIKEAEKTEIVKTMFNRIRPIPEINSSEIMKKKAAERMVINTPIQGSAADILKLAMIKIYSEIKNENDIKILLQVHDELIFEIEENKIDYYYQKIKNIMESIVKLEIPLIAEGKIGKNWGEMNKIKKASI